MLRNKLGITLIALVINIVVLVIIAGVAINLGLGENGIIGKTQNSVDKYKQAEEKEQIDLAKYGNMIAGNRIIDEADIEAIVNKVMLKKYPVGSIYCSVSNVDPGTFIGGTWTRISQGRVLMGASDEEADGFVAGTIKKAGLPNITGRSNLCLWAHGPSGAFYKTRNGTWKSAGGRDDGSANTYEYFADFDASRSNSIYGASNTVQPPAYVVYMWQRTE